VSLIAERGSAVAVHAALERAVDHLLSLQSADGWWKGELETNVTMDAEDLLLREFLGIRTADETSLAARWIRSQQRSDGTWANFHGGPPDLSTTIEAYAALRLAGDPPAAEHMRRAAGFVLEAGGLERARVFTHLWFALFGLWPWDAVPALPPEVMFLPSWFPLNPYDFACWARQTIVALTVVGAHRPVRPIPALGGLDELRSGLPPRRPPAGAIWAGAFERLDRALRWYERHASRGLRRIALTRATEWILARQEADGSWGGIQPPWVYSLMALRLQGYALDHPAVRAGLEGLDRFVVVDDRGRRLEACQSPVWDTALAVIGLVDAGVAPEHPAVQGAARWLVGQEIRVPGDWVVRRPALDPGGWAFEFENDHYPDIDDTAEVILALRRVVRGLGADDRRSAEAAIGRGVRWILGMQSADGGWGAFDVDNTRTLARELPFCDFGEVIDPPSADVTAHVVEMLAAEGLGGLPATRRGLARLGAWQEPAGSWFGRWGANHVYGTGASVPAAAAAGVVPSDARVRAAVRWLEAHQHEDGGWGEDLRSYDDPDWAGRGHTTASQTAWALLALLAAGERSPAVDRGVAWLVDRQTGDGAWEEPWFTGTGFPGDFFINYHLYRLVFPITALGRYLHDPNPAATLAARRRGGAA
jgi:squalene-hopene/tetraprenyl-beta-curcumene cyclase